MAAMNSWNHGSVGNLATPSSPRSRAGIHGRAQHTDVAGGYRTTPMMSTRPTTLNAMCAAIEATMVPRRS